MTTVLHASDAPGLLGLVPVLAGFTPQRSVVVLPFHGTRCHGAMRMDLPDPRERPGFVQGAVSLIARVGDVAGAAVVIYTDRPSEPGGPLPHTGLVSALGAALSERGLDIVDLLCVAPDGWGSYLRPDGGMHPLGTIPPPPTVIGVMGVEADQEAGAALPSPDATVLRAVSDALSHLDAVLDAEASGTAPPARTHPQALNAALLLDDLPQLFESALETPTHLPPFTAAALLWCLHRPIFRDVALLQWATDEETGRDVLRAQLHHAHVGDAVPDRFGGVLIGNGSRPDGDRLRLALTITRIAAALAPEHLRPGPLAVAAWLSWALGRSTHALRYLDEARQIDPHHSLAELVRTLIDTVALPAWVFRRGTPGGLT